MVTTYTFIFLARYAFILGTVVIDASSAAIVARAPPRSEREDWD